MARRLRLKPAPGPEALRRQTVHEVVRDYPEALVALRRAGGDAATDGGRPVGEVSDAEEVVAAILAATAWRPDPPATPSSGTIGGVEGGP